MRVFPPLEAAVRDRSAPAQEESLLQGAAELLIHGHL